jgi:hypothetical protein
MVGILVVSHGKLAERNMRRGRGLRPVGAPLPLSMQGRRNNAQTLSHHSTPLCMMVAAIVTAFLGEYIDTGVIVAVLDSGKEVMSMQH